VRALVQRVSSARVLIDAEPIGAIGRGIVVLLGVKRGDREQDARWLADKCANLRLFEDGAGKMNLSVGDIGGGILAVPQFTLYGDCRHGRRPGFTEAAPPEEAEQLYRAFVAALEAGGVKVQTGVFRARMEVEIHNDGPVTLMVETP